MKTPANTKSAHELARSTGSAVARASYTRPGGVHGPQGAKRNRADRRAAKRTIKNFQEF